MTKAAKTTGREELGRGEAKGAARLAVALSKAEPVMHTPGEWTIHDQTPTELRQPTRQLIRGDHPDRDGSRVVVASFVRASDARLIAAAPELLEALRFIVNDSEPGENAVLSVDGYKRALAALAKAVAQ